ncbi:MAG TPA: MlaD family protein [Mesorhizobium sp.]|jgi:phospholipid/cholesterol/gamma-HCH transport system substrate-binding protein|nr:MlaD family protein [Mesorhizobium sp.]
METKANYLVVGIFTLFAVLAAFGFVYWTAAIGDQGDIATLRVRIPGSASGLARGSQVLFNGVPVGTVRRVYIDVQNPAAAIADTEVDRLTPVTESTQADIGIAGLTGQANIELKGSSLQEKNLLDAAEAEGTVAEITARPSAVTNLLQTAQDIFERTDRTLVRIEGFVSEVQGPLAQTVRNTEQFSAALAENADGIDGFLQSVSSLSDELAGASAKLDGTLAAAEGLLNAVNREQVGQIVANVESFTNDLRESGQNLDRIAAEAQSTVQSFRGIAEQGQASLARVDQLIAGVDPEAIRNTVANVEQATSTANSAITVFRDAGQTANNVLTEAQKVVNAVAGRTEDVNQIITDAQQLAGRLNQTSVRVEGVIGRVDELLSSERTETLVADASATLRSFRDTAESVSRIVTSPEVQGLVGRASETLATFQNTARTINQVVSSPEAQSLVTDASAALQSVRNSAQRVEEIVSAPEVQGLVSSAEETLASFRAAARTVNDFVASPETEGLIQTANAALLSIRDGAQSVNRIVSTTDFQGLTRTASEALTAFRDTARTVNETVASPEAQGLVTTASAALNSFRDSAESINRLVTSEETQGLVNTASAALNSFRTSAESIEKIATSPEVQSVLTTAGETLNSFRQTAETVNALFASPEAQGILTEASQTIAAFRGVADTLNARIGPIADNLTQFSERGLEGVTEFVRSAQRSVTRIEQAVTDFERNPQRVLSGGEGEVRKHNGRNRR